jgi:uncharacterized delta-60 repeat protein
VPILCACVLCSCAALYGIEDRPRADNSGSDGGSGPSIAVAPPSVTLEVGGAVDLSIDLRRDGLAGLVTVVVSDLPPGVTASTLAIASDATHGVIHVSAAANAAPGSYAARAAAVAGALSMTAPVTVVVRGQPGTLDTTFGRGGILHVDGSSSLVSTLARQADGSFLTGGCEPSKLGFGIVDGPPLHVVRYLASGALDPSFGTNGSVTVPGASGTCIYALAVQADGRILVGGDDVPDGGAGFVRYDADGTVDTSFAAAGEVAASHRAFALAPDGAIIAALVSSTTAANGGSDLHAVVNRYTPAGALVWSVTTATTSEPRAVFVRPDGRILVVGDSQETAVLLLQYTPDGKLDPSFGSSGMALGSDPGGGYVISEAATLLADGRVLVGTTGNRLWRFDPQGVPDASFGAGGKLSIAPPEVTSGPGVGFTGVAVAGDGKILTSSGANCSATAPSCQDLLLLRVDASGAPDTSFGAGGVARVPGVATSLVAPTLPAGPLIFFEPDGRIRVLVPGGPAPGEVTAVRLWP